ncbi:hypothetical protein BDU57DRAFT_514533 [Ampelomyces quisqualis]|uniref:Uncharacterized protein n=1 Tax=Ampelomyces quisqualis TaxID=50730 RepID=A0A6A5QT30_AMPQU|nr:hypothetical protein BDU57DRAFT_514533 [Ampelomyces quisqualis]
MLDRIHDWEPVEAAEIMRSFRDDSENEGREIRFVSERRRSREYAVRIMDPNASVFHPRIYNRAMNLRAEKRPKRLDWNLAPNGARPHTCPGGCDPGCPRGTTPMGKIWALERKRMAQKEAENAEVKRALEGLITISENRARQRAMLPPPRPAKSKPQPLSAEKLSQIQDASSDPSPNDPAPKPNLKLTMAQWQELDPLQLPATPRLKPLDLGLDADQHKRLDDPITPLERGSRSSSLGSSSMTDSPRQMTPSSSASPEPRRMPRLRLRLPSRPQPTSKYVRVAKQNRPKIDYYCNVLPLSATQVTEKYLGPRKTPATTNALANLEKHKVDISQMLTPAAQAAAQSLTLAHHRKNTPNNKKVVKKTHPKVESWQLDPDRH